MGKLNIPLDVKNKLENVLGAKMTDINETNTAPAPKWDSKKTITPPAPPPPPPPNIPFQETPSLNSPIKEEKRRDIIKKSSKIEEAIEFFGYSVILGIGVSFGVKIGLILFY
jgi:hypothetical protein